MASQPEPILPGTSDPKYLDLIDKITAKTRANKIRWKSTPTGHSATVSGEIQLGFVRSRGGGLTSPKGWALFTIRDENENEILRVENMPFLIGIDAADEEPIRRAVGTLYSAIEQMGRAEVQKVIELIDKI